MPLVSGQSRADAASSYTLGKYGVGRWFGSLLPLSGVRSPPPDAHVLEDMEWGAGLAVCSLYLEWAHPYLMPCHYLYICFVPTDQGVQLLHACLLSKPIQWHADVHLGR